MAFLSRSIFLVVLFSLVLIAVSAPYDETEHTGPLENELGQIDTPVEDTDPEEGEGSQMYEEFRKQNPPVGGDEVDDFVSNERPTHPGDDLVHSENDGHDHQDEEEGGDADDQEVPDFNDEEVQEEPRSSEENYDHIGSLEPNDYDDNFSEEFDHAEGEYTHDGDNDQYYGEADEE